MGTVQKTTSSKIWDGLLVYFHVGFYVSVTPSIKVHRNVGHLELDLLVHLTDYDWQQFSRLSCQGLSQA